MSIAEEMENGILLFDGAMGTMLYKAGLQAGELPERMNIQSPDAVLAVHEAYVNAGADIITANTFQANRLKYPNPGEVEEVICAGVKLAKQSGARYVALDVGPMGKMFVPLGEFTFSMAYAQYAQQMVAAERAGADIVLLETFSDLYELKIAVLAAKENTALPIFCTMTFQADGHTFMGCDPETFAQTACGLGVQAIGANCSLGPAELKPIVKRILSCVDIPVMVQANAGLPKTINGETSYEIDALAFAKHMEDFRAMGVSVIGGCCGATPEFIHQLTAVRDRGKVSCSAEKHSTVTTGDCTLMFDRNIVFIGNRISKVEGAPQDEDAILEEITAQREAGSQIVMLELCEAVDTPESIYAVVSSAQAFCQIPLLLKGDTPELLETAARVYNGKPMLYLPCDDLYTRSALPIAKKYGASILCALSAPNEPQIAAEQGLSQAENILNIAAEFAIGCEDILFDCTLQSNGGGVEQSIEETINAIQLIVSKLGVKTAVDLSRFTGEATVSRQRISSLFTPMHTSGINALLFDPLDESIMRVVEKEKENAHG